MCKIFVTIHAEHMQNNILVYFMMCNKSIQKKLKKSKALKAICKLKKYHVSIWKSKHIKICKYLTQNMHRHADSYEKKETATKYAEQICNNDLHI